MTGQSTAPQQDGDEHESASAYQPDAGTFQKSISIRAGKTEAIVVEMPQWDRIERRVKGLEDLWAIEWLVAGASAAGSTAIGCLIAAFSLPTGDDTGIGPAVKPCLFFGAVACALLAITLLALHVRVKKDRTKEGSDIIDEMETYEKSFELKRSVEAKSSVETPPPVPPSHAATK
jgi:hypothetical protein